MRRLDSYLQIESSDSQLLILGGIAGMAISLQTGVPVGVALVAWSVAGLGMGVAFAPTSLMMLRETSAGRAGRTSASLNLSDVLGTALGTGLGGGALVAASNQGWSLSTGVLIAFGVAGVGALVALLVVRRLPLQRAGRPAALRVAPSSSTLDA